MAEQGIESYVAQGELATRSSRELAAVGLSMDFPARMRELNDGLMYWKSERGTFAGLRFNLHPDTEFPAVDVEARYVSPYLVTVDAGTDHRARLDVQSNPRNPGTLAILGLPQLKTFTADYPTERSFWLEARPRHPGEPFRGRRFEPIPAQRFTAIETAEDLQSLGMIPGSHDLNLGFTATHAAVALDLSFIDEPRTASPVFWVNGIKARDTSANIEALVGAVGALVKENWNLPDGPRE